MQYVADFETTTDVDDCRVWAWAACELDAPDVVDYGNCIATFVDFMEKHPATYYFHNLAFDGEFIICYLLGNGYQYADELKEHTFNTLISDTGKFYSMEIRFADAGRKPVSAEIRDSMKKLPMSVAAIAKSFDLPISKLTIDYDEKRPAGHELTQEEKAYITHDVQIVAYALQVQFAHKLTRLTVGSDALNEYMQRVGQRRWRELFPLLDMETDSLIRRAYKGGWTYCNPRYQADVAHPARCVGAGSVYDVNSLYPDVMYNRPLPVGAPIPFTGRYKDDRCYPLYIQFLTASAKLKQGFFPTLQIKNSPYFCKSEYVTDTGGAVELALTNVDLELLNTHYDVRVESYDGGFCFAAQVGLFRTYIDEWMQVKKNSTGGKRQIAKLMLNSLYGKFATNPDCMGKVPFLNDDGSVGYMLGPQDYRDCVYTPLACFVTAWARYKTITTAQAVYDRFLYADTDSVHVLGTEPLDVESVRVHPSELGAWKHESDFDKGKYVRAKTYMERITAHGVMRGDDYIMQPCEPYNDVKCAGLPNELKPLCTFDNFQRGLQLFGKLRPKHVAGGIVLVPTTFTLI